MSPKIMFNNGVTTKIKLTSGVIITIDSEDTTKVMSTWWSPQYRKNGDLARIRTSVKVKGKLKTISLHSFLIGKKSGKVIDHKDRDVTNNKKANLRHCTQQQNCFNRVKKRTCTNPYKGVYFVKARNKFIGFLSLKNKYIGLGMSDNPKVLARRYNKQAKIHLGEYAKLNAI